MLTKEQVEVYKKSVEEKFRAAVMERDRQARLVDLYDGASQACDELIAIMDADIDPVGPVE